MDNVRVTAQSLSDSPWLRPIVRPVTTGQLIMLPHAGGSAYAYRDWASILPAEFALSAVEYPGYGSRISEEPIDDPAVMITELAGLLAEVRAQLDGRLLILGGHSLGAMLAYEVALVLQAAGRPVDALLLSGSVPAHQGHLVPDLSVLSDAALAAALGADGDIPAAVLDDADARSFYLPLVRRGLAFARRTSAVAAASSAGRERVHAPVVVLGGTADLRCPASALGSWADVVDGPLEIALLPGGHFFHRGQLGEVGRLLTGLITRVGG
ncbi:thioesterase II family protein [Micromonospora sp. DT231]|uniref:thioesterase II family protein n=1 Tax=Micromonospora sp. DT231 TaxID=3416526 RepID=UPI003CEAEBB8